MSKERRCEGCGEALPADANWRRKWCSEPCRRLHLYSRPCPGCGTAMDGSNGRGKHAPKMCITCTREQPHTVERAALLGERRSEPVWTDGELLGYLWRAADGASTASGKRYEAVRRPTWPSRATIEVRFEGWNRALECAGLEPGRRLREYTRFSATECVAAVSWCARDLGRVPAYRDYEAWHVDNLGSPCGTLVRRRCGSWPEALRLAMERVAA